MAQWQACMLPAWQACTPASVMWAPPLSTEQLSESGIALQQAQHASAALRMPPPSELQLHGSYNGQPVRLQEVHGHLPGCLQLQLQGIGAHTKLPELIQDHAMPRPLH